MGSFHILRTKVKEDNLSLFNDLHPDSMIFSHLNLKLKNALVVDRE